MIVGLQILRLSVLCAGVLAVLATPSTAQSTGGAPAPLSDADITRILAERIDAQQQSVGIVVGVLEPGGRRVLSHGHPAKGDPRRVDGDTVFEIGSITKVFTALLLADAVERGEVSLSDPVLAVSAGNGEGASTWPRHHAWRSRLARLGTAAASDEHGVHKPTQPVRRLHGRPAVCLSLRL